MADTSGTRGVVVFPGGMYGPYAPLLMFAADAAQLRGAQIRGISWTDEDAPPRLAKEDRGSWVTAQAVPALDQAAADWPGVTPLVIAKSLGVHVAALAADRGLPAVWLTPDLTSDWVVTALRRATAPYLLVGGTGDKMWDSPRTHELSPYVCEVQGADHGMYVPGRLAASAAVLGRVATAVEDFLDTVIWP